MSHDITIRPGQPNDLAELQRLNSALFIYEHEQGHYKDSYNLNWPYEDAGIKFFTGCLGESPDHTAFIAEANGRIIGYLAGSFAVKAYRSLHNPFGELDNMFVEEAFRHAGVGARLFDAFKAWLIQNQVDRVSVAAFSRNAQALNFYRTLGCIDSAIILEMPLAAPDEAHLA
jgi:GNAT superfamily N-acetyltransferase